MPESDIVEEMAEAAHEAWRDAQREQGVISRKASWGEEFMVPFPELSERGREFDRVIMRAILGVLHERYTFQRRVVVEGVTYMDIQEFVEGGFLQEANRFFFHPLGIALEVTTEDGINWWLSGIWDSRDDPLGFEFAPDDLSKEKSDNVLAEYERHLDLRRAKFGGGVQSIRDARVDDG